MRRSAVRWLGAGARPGSSRWSAGVNGSYLASSQKRGISTKVAKEHAVSIAKAASAVETQGLTDCFLTSKSILLKLHEVEPARDQSYWSILCSPRALLRRFTYRTPIERLAEHPDSAREFRELFETRGPFILKAEGIVSNHENGYSFADGSPATSRFSNRHGFHAIVVFDIVTVEGELCALTVNPEEGGPRIHEVEKANSLTDRKGPLDAPMEIYEAINRAVAHVEVLPLRQILARARYKAQIQEIDGGVEGGTSINPEQDGIFVLSESTPSDKESDVN